MVTVRFTCGQQHVWADYVSDGEGRESAAFHRRASCPTCQEGAVAVATTRNEVELDVATFGLPVSPAYFQAMRRVRRENGEDVIGGGWSAA